MLMIGDIVELSSTTIILHVEFISLSLLLIFSSNLFNESQSLYNGNKKIKF